MLLTYFNFPFVKRPHLREMQMARVRLTRARFDQAQMDRAVLLHCTMDQASFAAAELTGTIFRDGTFAGACFTQARGYRTQFLRGGSVLPLQDAQLKQVLLTPRAGRVLAVEQRLPPSAQPHLRWISGHQAWVSSCAWSCDGTRLLSAGDDGTLRVWDAQTGALLRVHAITQHGHAVWLPQEDTVVETRGDAWRCLA